MFFKQHFILILLFILLRVSVVHAATNPMQTQINLWIQKQSTQFPPKTRLLLEINRLLLPANTTILKIQEQDNMFYIRVKSKARSSSNDFVRKLQASLVFKDVRLLTLKSVNNTIIYTLNFTIEPAEKIISYSKASHALTKSQTQVIQLHDDFLSSAKKVGKIIDFCPNIKNNKKPIFLPPGIKLVIYPYQLHMLGSYRKILQFIQQTESNAYYTALQNINIYRQDSLYHFTASLRLFGQALRRNATDQAYTIEHLASRVHNICSIY